MHMLLMICVIQKILGHLGNMLGEPHQDDVVYVLQNVINHCNFNIAFNFHLEVRIQNSIMP